MKQNRYLAPLGWSQRAPTALQMNEPRFCWTSITLAAAATQITACSASSCWCTACGIQLKAPTWSHNTCFFNEKWLTPEERQTGQRVCPLSHTKAVRTQHSCQKKQQNWGQTLKLCWKSSFTRLFKRWQSLKTQLKASTWTSIYI